MSNPTSLRQKLSLQFRNLLTVISPRLNTEVIYYLSKGNKINLDNPQTFDEKVSWLKLNLYNDDKLVSQCADKYAVRKYVEDTGYVEILNELYGVYDNVDDIPWDLLPKKFALKLNNGAGTNIICTNKDKLDIEEATNKFKSWMKKKYHLMSSELQYKHIVPKIICEKFIETEDNHAPEDYKIYCFNGKVAYTMLCIGREKGKPKFYFFDKNWEIARLNKDSKDLPEGYKFSKPENLDKMFEIAEKLSNPFPFVRVDLYNIEGDILFGELTFTPNGGKDENLPKETDKYFGELLKLPKIR